MEDPENEVLLSQDENLTGEADNRTIAAMMSTMNDNLQLLLKRVSTLEHERPSKEQRSEPCTASENVASGESDSENLVNEHRTEFCTGKASGDLSVTNNDKNTSKAGENLLNEIAHDYSPETSTSPTISQKLAKIVDNRWSKMLESNKLKDKMEQYSRPENCEKLIVPRVNPEVWNKLGHTSHGSDLKMAGLQKPLVRVGSACLNAVHWYIAFTA